MRIIQQQWREQRLHFPGRHTFLPYYTGSPWLAGEESFLFCSVTQEFRHPRLGICSTVSRGVEKWIELADWNDEDPGCIIDDLTNSALRRESEEVFVPRGASLYTVSLRTGECRLLRREEPGDGNWFSGPAAFSADGRYCALPFYSPPRRCPARTEMLLFELPEFRLIRRYDFGNFMTSHFQFQRDPEYIQYAHEGQTQTIFDRINRIHWPSGRRECLHRHLCDLDSGELLECIGHEMAAQQADRICAVRYPDSRIRAAILLLDQDGANCREFDCDDYWHVSCTPDGNILAADTMWWGRSRRRTPNRIDIIRLDTRARTKEIVKTVHSIDKGQHRHPHPQLDSTGRRLLFMENSPESDQLASVTLAELAE